MFEIVLEIVLVLFLLLGIVVTSTVPKPKKPHVCTHKPDLLCTKYGCPDDPDYRGDRRA